jgi:hypothetical protein
MYKLLWTNDRGRNEFSQIAVKCDSVPQSRKVRKHTHTHIHTYIHTYIRRRNESDSMPSISDGTKSLNQVEPVALFYNFHVSCTAFILTIPISLP